MTRPRLMPIDTPDYMAPAWVGCMYHAIRCPEIVAQFRADTGNKWTPGKSAFEDAIDDATGAGDKFVETFVAWANVNVWGPIDGDAP